MSSTFKELADDCRVRLRLYTERIQYTEDMFMRFFVKGMQTFQRETALLESIQTLTKDVDSFPLPTDCFHIIDIQDSDGISLVSNSPSQFLRNKQTSYSGEIVRLDYDRRGQYANQTYKQRRIYSVQARYVYLFPDKADTELRCYYIPSIEPFMSASTQWAAWFVDDDVFLLRFQTTRPNEVFAPYEDALVQFAVAEWLKTDSNQNFALYEKKFWEEVARAKDLKQQFFRRGNADYSFAPYY